ncbi:MAG: DUF58 domain-containing protein [Verrucomicrobiales bacterium]|nr:DUF58 domain-containing protein [Verrucomicrobiales bacterium]MBE87726.1 DUF58 domain-containing protein [Verrucomicrobiales bacterium]
MEGTVSGHHRSPHRGSSVEFAEYRNYVPGDDIRRLDWRVFARTDRYYLKEFEAETNLRCYVVLDCSGSMGFKGNNGIRFDYAKRLAATLSYLVINQGDAAGLVHANAKDNIEIPPRRNASHLQLILDSLNQASPKGETNLIPLLHELAEKARRRALVIILSDCFCDETELRDALQHLRFQKHDLALFHLLDPLELDFTFDRPVRFVDMEGSQSIVTEPATIRAEYQLQLTRFLKKLQTNCHEFNADYRQVTIDQPYDRVLADFLNERARRIKS